MTQPKHSDCAAKAGRRIARLYLVLPIGITGEGEANNYWDRCATELATIIEAETRVGEKEEALRGCKEWIRIVAGGEPNKATGELLDKAQAALGDKPETPK